VDEEKARGGPGVEIKKMGEVERTMLGRRRAPLLSLGVRSVRKTTTRKRSSRRRTDQVGLGRKRGEGRGWAGRRRCWANVEKKERWAARAREKKNRGGLG
jgi:hypothetical protein